MKITDKIASEIAVKVLDHAEKCGIQSWALSPIVLVRDAIIEWEKRKRKRPTGGKSDGE